MRKSVKWMIVFLILAGMLFAWRYLARPEVKSAEGPEESSVKEADSARGDEKAGRADGMWLQSRLLKVMSGKKIFPILIFWKMLN